MHAGMCGTLWDMTFRNTYFDVQEIKTLSQKTDIILFEADI